MNGETNDFFIDEGSRVVGCRSGKTPTYSKGAKSMEGVVSSGELVEEVIQQRTRESCPSTRCSLSSNESLEQERGRQSSSTSAGSANSSGSFKRRLRKGSKSINHGHYSTTLYSKVRYSNNNRPTSLILQSVLSNFCVALLLSFSMTYLVLHHDAP